MPPDNTQHGDHESSAALPGLASESRASHSKQSTDSQRRPLTLPKIISFESLARCGDEIWIECNGQMYRLRKTRSGKLILTK